jgi:MFS transporter, putative metabolite:H+ symporter
MSNHYALTVTARIDRLPPTASIWRLVVLLSVGGFFEVYDLFQMTYLPPGLIRDGIFHVGAKGLFGLSDQATLGAATFVGLFVGEMGVARLADHFGRRAVFTGALLLYTLASLAMCAQSTAAGVNLCRLVAGIGAGAELITIGAYLTELVPKAMRGRAFAVSFAISYLAMPVLAFASWLLVPRAPLGLAGWRWVVLLGGSGAIAVWWLQSRIPESPRWLAMRGREGQAEAVLAAIESRVEHESGRLLPEVPPVTASHAVDNRASMWEPRYRARTLMLIAFNACLSIGFFGFSQWLPSLISAQGTPVARSLLYSFVIAFAYPVSPFVAGVVSDRIERKWLIVAAALSAALFGVAFALASTAVFVILFGILITFCNATLASNATAYQAEIFPTAIRSRALGFVHSFGRLTGVASSYIVALILEHAGVPGVFVLIGASMMVVVFSIGVFGPRTNHRSLEEIAAAAGTGDGKCAGLPRGASGNLPG